MQEGTPVPPWGYRCVPGLNRHNHVYLQNSNMIVFMKLSTKHLHKNLYKTKQKNLKKIFFFFKKSHPFTKGSVGACMQILNLLTSQHHITAKDKNLYMCYKNIILGEKNSIASSQSSKLSVSTVLSTSYGWYKATLSKRTWLLKPKGPHPERVTGLPLQLY